MKRFLGSPIRSHLRHLVFAWFGQQVNLTDLEKAVGLSCVEFNYDRHLFLLGAQGNAEWFDVLQPRLSELFGASELALDVDILPFLRSVVEARPDEVFGALYEQLGLSDRWNARVAWCVNSHSAWQSSDAENCLLWICEHTESPWFSLDLALNRAAKANPVLAVKGLRIILERLGSQLHEEPGHDTSEGWAGTHASASPTDHESIVRRTRSRDIHLHGLLPPQMHWFEELVGELAEVHRTIPHYPGRPIGKGRRTVVRRIQL